jgi:catechol 2,3-dioxygenase-like lactoylglutathione lyase family enzyme
MTRTSDPAIVFTQTCPVLRIFDEDKAREFYLGFLGFTLDWEHRFEPDLPLYAQVSRSGVVLHLSGHHGDGSPGAMVFIRITGIEAWQQELAARNYRFARPGIVERPWGREVAVSDPFYNRLQFCEHPPAG